jgi:chloramphenicol O-acetyltransferase
MVEIRKGWRDSSQPAFMFGFFLSVSAVLLTPFALGHHAAVIVRF